MGKGEKGGGSAFLEEVSDEYGVGVVRTTLLQS